LLNPAFVSPAYALSAPGLVSPLNGALTTAADNPPMGVPEFQWAAVSGATSYRLQVSSDIAFTTRVVEAVTPNTSFTPNATGNNGGFSDGTWYWRVRAEAPAPVGSYSATWSFTKQWANFANAPSLISPADGATVEFYDQPDFSWEPVTGAAKYKLQIYSSPGGWATPTYTANTLSVTHQPHFKLANGNYYWRVVPIDVNNREGTPSPERSFTAGYNPELTLLEPDNFANPTFTPTFRWTAVRGAQLYRLQYSTDPSFGANVTTVDTRNTAHTPTSTIPNDVNYYWRVRTLSGNSVSNWTDSRSFIKRWYIKPVPLTPVNNYQHVRFPLYSWTPVPGAARYLVEISFYPNFDPMYDSGYSANTFFSPSKYNGCQCIYYWRVTPFDGNDRRGSTSATASYRSYYNSVAPQPVYPLYYYPPDTYAGFPTVTTNPHEDRTVGWPIFVWHRVYVPSLDPNEGEVYADAYRLEVSTDATFSSVNWTVVTENTVATPTTSNPFTPSLNTDYYWRVRPIINNVDVGEWSQIWKTRFDPARGVDPINGSVPTLIRPTDGFEFAEATPALEWIPLNGASSYDVQISRNDSFTQIVDSATVSNPAYAPTSVLAQRSLGDVDFGIYYWRVRISGGTWTETRRFQIAAQSQWKSTRTLGDSANRLQIGSDAVGDATANYDVKTLQVAQSSSDWYFGFDVPASPTQNVTYALYLDLDHQQNSGATFDARSYTVTTISSYRPEYAIYILQEGGLFNATKTYLYRWNGIGWNTVEVLNNIGGQLNKTGNYVELQLPNTAIGYGDTGGSYAISLFSLPPSSGLPQDSVPSDPLVPGSGPISRFANVTERMNLLAPFNNAGVDLTSYPSILPFFWDWPIRAPWSGAIMKAYLDPQFTTQIREYILGSDTAYYAQPSHAWGDDFNGDNTYYWRIQPRYRVGSNLILGAWSQGWRFERTGFVPANLKTSVTFATPTFSWDRVEGAQSYDLQIDDDPGFGTPLNINTRQNSYTDPATLANATYYWRVRVRRNAPASDVINDWTATQSFTLALPLPSGLNHVPSGVPGRAPALCWTPLIVNDSSNVPVLAAWKYRVQVSKDPAFSQIWDPIDTEQSCWTPTKAYDDGQYYWRVAMMDGQGKLGNYTAAQTFTKQYPTTTLVSPAPGATPSDTPTFVWTPVNGAARYRFEVSLFPNFSPKYDEITTDSVRWTPTKKYTMGSYYWRVAMVDAENKVGPFVDATIIITDGKIPVSVYIGPGGAPIGSYGLDVGESMRQSYGLNNGPVRITSSLANIIGAERVVYKANNVGTSFSEIMGLPDSQLDTMYWLPWYNNVELDTQLRFANVSGATATVQVSVGGNPMPGSPFTLGPGESTRKSFLGVNDGPVMIQSDVNIVVAERVVYKVNGVGTSFTEMMALPNSHLDTTYWLPWYNNTGDLDTQLRFANVSTSTATVRVFIGGAEMSGSPYTLLAGESTRKSYTGVSNGPVKIESNVPIVAAERVVYKVNNVPTSFSEMMAMPNTRLDNMYWLPWYNNKELDTQLRFANVTTSTATVHVYMGGVEMPGSPFTLGPGVSTRASFVNANDGPVQIESNVNIVAAERVVYKVNNVNTSFTEMMGLPNSQLDDTYWLPWYNNIELDTQLRFGVP
jgi:hypothetical protein